MNLNTAQRRQWLKKGEFAALFNEIGWDNLSARPMLSIGGEKFTLSPVAQKRGVQVFHVAGGADGKMPDYTTRRKIEKEATKQAREHLLIFTDAAKKQQIWQWVAREPGRPAQVREIPYSSAQDGAILLQKLEGITFTLSEEEGLNIVAVSTRLKDHFDRDKVTKKFYDRFAKEHPAFRQFIKGIGVLKDVEWYTSVMINRVMFLYFVQAKGFLDRDPRYLQNRLAGSKKKYGADKFYSTFLHALFFEGLAKRESERTADARRDLGKLPYLSGSLFVRHAMEEKYDAIAIPDAAFVKLFAFLDDFEWRLDDRPVADGKHINPDVLGYIFEKYINQKQMGAYYTKEDITEYISKNTILPFVLERARERCTVAFEGESAVWRYLAEEPDRYIYPAVRHGVENPLPKGIEAGIADVALRGGWNKPAPDTHALPTEIWREAVARRQRYAEVKGKLAAGEVKTVADLITLNLNIRQFAQDVTERAEGPELLRAIWKTLTGSEKEGVLPLTVLDPTCGSGAFLFAALEILQPIYEACLLRMEGFVSDADRLERPKEYPDFRAVLAETEKHPNHDYYVLKRIITHNLYGVDIMEEATEICKLRLFLKLASQAEPDDKKDNLGIEPLPDIDFNIRAGNTLVGFASEEQTKKAVTGRLDFDDAWTRIKERAAAVETQFAAYQRSQTEQDVTSGAAALMKAALRAQLQPLRDELDIYLAQQYGIIGDSKAAKVRLAEFRESHKPFHWFVEFYRVLRNGGFDVIVGNPPYVEYSKVTKDYRVKGYETLECGNLYAYVMERNAALVAPTGISGMIIPHSAVCTDRMVPVQSLLTGKRKQVWVSTYDIRPSKLFVGVDQRLAIYLLREQSTPASIYSSSYYRWNDEFRPNLLPSVQYADITSVKFPNSLSKIRRDIEIQIWEKILAFPPMAVTKTPTVHRIYFHNAPRYWVRAMNFAPYFWNERDGEQVSSHLKSLFFFDESEAKAAVAALNSSLFYWWFVALSNCRDLTLREIEHFPVGFRDLTVDLKANLSLLSDRLMNSLQENSFRKECEYRATGKVIYDEFYPRHSKDIIDEIDRALAKHYGFNAEELDFIINYDIKYRMGLSGGADEDEE